MKTFKYYGLALTGALTLAACGTTSAPQNNAPKPTPGANTPAPQPGAAACATIVVNLKNVAPVNGKIMAPVTVKNKAGATVFSGTVEHGQKLATALSAGTYTVAPAKMQGYEALANTPQSVTLDCTVNKEAAVTLEYKASPQAVAQIKSIMFDGDSAVTDGEGMALSGVRETNSNKNVMLYASQTEEPVLVQMVVRDAAGAPVAGARVNVSADSSAVTIIPGHVSTGGSATPLGMSAQSVAASATAFSDDEGIVRFTVYATSAPAQGTPVKFVVSATEATASPTSAALAEFKMFFTNMSHLYYSGDTSFGDSATIPTNRRVGASVGSFENNWFNQNQRLHTFSTVAKTKQPETGPYPVGGGQGAQFPGYVTYTLQGVSGQENDLGRLFLTTNSSAMDGSSTVRVDAGQPVYLRPDLDVTAQELPLTTNVRANYYYQVRYGNTTYDFLLKSYDFTKTFTGATLEIEKTGPNILTWTGFERVLPNRPAHDPYAPDDVTLPPRLDNGNRTVTTEDNFTVGKTYTYVIRVRNTSGTIARNVAVRDELPAELGYVLGSARLVDAAGANAGAVDADYDLNTHTIDFNTIGDLAANAELRIAIDVYPRHKPGYAWNDNDRDGNSDPVTNLQGAYGLTPPEQITDLNVEYEDPYDIKNRAKATASNAAEVDAYKYINIVRPVARITKTALDSEVVTNQLTEFLIRISNFDRSTTNELDPRIRTAYARLKSLFPTEYAQESFLYNARIEDTYGPAFSGPVARDEQGNILALERFDQASGDRRVGLNLGTMLNGTTRTIRLTLRGEVVGDYNYNCVRLFAWNLNQLYRGNPFEYQHFEGPAFQLVNGEVSAQSHTPAPAVPQYPLDRGRNFLEACDYVNIVGKPAWGHDLWDNIFTGTEFLQDTFTDAYPVGTQFVYDTYYENEGNNEATNVFIDAALPRMVNFINGASILVRFRNGDGTITDQRIDLRTPSTWSFMASGSTITMRPADDQRSFRFHVDRMDPNDRIMIEFQVVASQKGDDMFNTAMTWDQGNGRVIRDSEHTYITD